MLTNLGSNAVKFTEHGEVFIRATADARRRRRHPAAGRASPTPASASPRTTSTDLFEAFTQADASTTRVYGGTGLGLAISREIVEALGGEIGLRPNPGGGSVFWFTADFERPDRRPASTPTTSTPAAWLAGRRVLVVDDNEHNRLILDEQLARWRVRSVGVGRRRRRPSCAVAAAPASGDPFEAVLLDLSMPGRDGLDLARDAPRATRRTPSCRC